MADPCSRIVSADESEPEPPSKAGTTSDEPERSRSSAGGGWAVQASGGDEKDGAYDQPSLTSDLGLDC